MSPDDIAGQQEFTVRLVSLPKYDLAGKLSITKVSLRLQIQRFL